MLASLGSSTMGLPEVCSPRCRREGWGGGGGGGGGAWGASWGRHTITDHAEGVGSAEGYALEGQPTWCPDHTLTA